MRPQRSNSVQRYTGRTIFRSITPPELDDILRTGRLTGRVGKFSGDPRDGVFFGDEHGGIEGVIAQGEDTIRAIHSHPRWWGKFRALDPLYELDVKLDKEVRAYHDADRTPPSALWRKSRAVSEKYTKARKRLFDAMVDATKRTRQDWIAKRGVTSYVLEFRAPLGGTVYSGEDSMHAGGDEVAYAPGAVSADDLMAVYAVLHGAVVGTAARAPAGWVAEVGGSTVAREKSLKAAMRKLSAALVARA